MGRSTRRRRQAKQPSGRFAHSNPSVRNEKFRDMNRFGKHALGAFIGVLFIGYVLIFRPPIHVTVSPEGVTVLGAVLSGTAFRLAQTRRHRH
ncbi:hypothetical protein ACIRFH_32845 [Streptomyces sp. NPDC093586]|uniref:hypothetical protein n=1 Tax=Streptomyces sp. NPDC093586 TaxID=3366042 RepID=UPI00380BEDDC